MIPRIEQIRGIRSMLRMISRWIQNKYAEAQAADEPHVLGPDDFLGFISIYDDTRTSVTRFFK